MFEAAVVEGDSRAQYLLGTMYQNGFGAKRNDNEAFHWFLRAAENVHLEVQFQLGLMYLDGVV